MVASAGLPVHYTTPKRLEAILAPLSSWGYLFRVAPFGHTMFSAPKAYTGTGTWSKNTFLMVAIGENPHRIFQEIAYPLYHLLQCRLQRDSFIF